MVRIAAIAVAAALALAAPAGAQTRSVTGQFGVLGEWELTATLTQQPIGAWSGPLSLKHIGFCSADGAEEKTGELRLRLSDTPAEAIATVLINGDVCTFSGTLKDAYDGVMKCPGRRAIPMTLAVVR